RDPLRLGTGSRGVRRRAGRVRQRPRGQVPRREGGTRPRPPLRRRAASQHHPRKGAQPMSREFEIIREVDLPAAPDDVWTAITADDWEDQYDAIDGHTDSYLHTLGEYLEHFKGRPVTYVGQPSAGIEGPEAAGTPDAMDRLRAALGVADGAAVGDAVHAHLGDAGSLDGVIDYVTPEFLGVRDDD